MFTDFVFAAPSRRLFVMLIVAGSAVMLAMGTHTAIASADTTTTVTLSASSYTFLDTGVNILPGTSATVTVTGDGAICPVGSTCARGPGGSGVLCASDGFQDGPGGPTVPYGAVAGRVGSNGSPFYVGGGTTVSSPGEFYVVFNDCNPPGGYSDNSGSFEVTITTPPTTTTTAVACAAQSSPSGTFACTATVTPSSVTGGDLPSGSVDWSVPDVGLSDESCTLAADPSGTSSSCSVLVTPTQTGNQSDLPVTGDYGGDDNYEASTGGGNSPGSTIPAVQITATAPKTTNTALEGSNNASFVVTLSRPASVTTTVDYQSANGSGSDGLKEADGDYAKTSGTLMFTPGVTTKTVNVKVFADIHVRVDGEVDLVLSSPAGATFADSTVPESRSLSWLRPHAPTGTRLTVANDVHPHLEVGDVYETVHGRILIRHYGDKRYSVLHGGEKIYVGDDLLVDADHGRATAVIQFLIGGIAVIDNTVGPGHWHINDARDVTHEYESSVDSYAEVLRQKIRILYDISQEKTTRYDCTPNGGFMSIKG